MPSPSTPRRSSRRQSTRSTPSKSKEDVKPLGIHDTNSVQDRIRQWQEQVGGVAASDVSVADEEENPPARSTRKDSTPRRKSSKLRVEDEQKEDTPERSKSTPKKRIISDGHWKKKRSPPKNHGKVVTPSKEDRSARRKRKEEDTRKSTEADDDLRVHATPTSPRRQSGQDMDAGSEPGSLENEPAPSLKETPSPPSKESSARRRKDWESSGAKDDGRHRRRSQRTDPLEKSHKSAQGTFSEARGSTRSYKGSIFSQVLDESKKIFTKSEPVPVPTPRVPSIEAWLQETPDPFVDEQEPPVEIPAPLNASSKKKKLKVEETVPEDPNQIWNAVDKDEKHRRKGGGSGSRRRHRERPTVIDGDAFSPRSPLTETDLPKTGRSQPNSGDVAQDERELSPSSLRRRGAKGHSSSPRARRGSFPLKDSIEEGPKDETPEVTLPAFDTFDLTNFAKSAPLNLRRSCPPTGGHRLSTIASAETLQTKTEAQDDHPSDPEARDTFNPDSLNGNPGGLKRRLTTHADLISVLSLPKAGSKSIRSARSIRTNRSRLATATVPDLMQELASDEEKYMRELRTLVDGVIPVLLTCVLSKTDSAVAAGLFRSCTDAGDNLNFTKPIVDMGIALERLKTLHKRIPHHGPYALLLWAQGAGRVYAEYIKAWRLGFQDVVVNLAPADEEPHSDGEDGMPRDADGDVINGDGEKVDVAFLLKRPLVRLKYLAKTFKGINIVKPSVNSEDVATKYQSLVEDARRRSNEERARLEDEAAANIDPSRARDPRTLAVLAGVTVDRTRRVRARDYFNLALHHSTGQRVDCRTELLLRDNATETGGCGDLLICEVDDTGRWLLFPPVDCGRLSARNGDFKGEIVVMIRGEDGQGREWQELLSLRTEDEQTGFEWVQMLGLTPVPPKLVRSQSFIEKQRERQPESPTTTSKHLSTGVSRTATPNKSRTPSPREVDVPIGEKATVVSKGVRSPPSLETHRQTGSTKSPLTPVFAHMPKSPLHQVSSPPNDEPPNDSRRPRRLSKAPPSPEAQSTPRSLDEAIQVVGDISNSGLRRSKAKRRSRHGDHSPTSPSPIASPTSEKDIRSQPGSRKLSRTDQASREWMSSPEIRRSNSLEPVLPERPTSRDDNEKSRPERPQYHRAPSSTPSKELPTIPKVRTNRQPSTPLTPTMQQQWSTLSGAKVEEPRSASKLQKRNPERAKVDAKTPFTEDIPTPPLHHSQSRSHSPVQLKQSKVPVLNLPPKSPASGRRGQRRSSSPLKHEYAPSTASESSSDSEASTIERNDIDSVSDISEEEELEDGDAPTPLLPMGALRRLSKASPPASLPTLSSATLVPSNSASQAPYKTVPYQPSKSSKTIASIFSWSDKGAWESLHPDECSVVITPGLIEAYEMSAMHSTRIDSRPALASSDKSSELSGSTIPDDLQPLVALELTPLVPLRRGTALDISIRSPPIEKSKITSGNNIMFRSRNPEECEALYAMINHSRINNPTYIALQNARGPYSVQPTSVGRYHSVRASSRSSSWFWGGSQRSSYRASSAPTPSSVAGASESSIGSMTSAFSALKRFGTGSKMFNISRSSVSSRNGFSRAGSIYSTSSGSGTRSSGGSGSNSPAPSQLDGAGAIVTKEAGIGLTNAKIRLYARETASKWRDMGAARLTIMPSTTTPTLRPSAASGPRLPSSDNSPHRSTGKEKRILINGKTKGEVLLDACLGESCFERVARTGIAVSVWEEFVGVNGEMGTVGKEGGVVGGRGRVFMIQMKSEAETAYTFSLVGKLRY